MGIVGEQIEVEQADVGLVGDQEGCVEVDMGLVGGTDRGWIGRCVVS